MTYQEFAAGLDGAVSYGHELDDYAEKTAKENGLVVVFGASDDLMEIRGAIDYEADVWGGGTVYLDRNGVFKMHDCDGDVDRCPYMIAARNRCKTITVVWGCKNESAAWTYDTDIPHATFRVFEDGELYCIGIVFSVEDLA